MTKCATIQLNNSATFNLTTPIEIKHAWQTSFNNKHRIPDYFRWTNTCKM